MEPGASKSLTSRVLMLGLVPLVLWAAPAAGQPIRPATLTLSPSTVRATAGGRLDVSYEDFCFFPHTLAQDTASKAQGIELVGVHTHGPGSETGDHRGTLIFDVSPSAAGKSVKVVIEMRASKPTPHLAAAGEFLAEIAAAEGAREVEAPAAERGSEERGPGLGTSVGILALIASAGGGGAYAYRRRRMASLAAAVASSSHDGKPVDPDKPFMMPIEDVFSITGPSKKPDPPKPRPKIGVGPPATGAPQTGAIPTVPETYPRPDGTRPGPDDAGSGGEESPWPSGMSPEQEGRVANAEAAAERARRRTDWERRMKEWRETHGSEPNIFTQERLAQDAGYDPEKT